MRTMYDAVTARNIPADARMVAGYIDKIKLEPWSAADWARFPNAVKVTIVKKASTNDGDVLDVEPGDATPAEAPGWVQRRRAAGADPTVYMNLSTWPTVRKAFADQNVAPPHYWVARYDGVASIPADWLALGCVAKQYAGDIAPGIDLNIVVDYWPGVDGNEDDMTPDEHLMLQRLYGQATGTEDVKTPVAAWGFASKAVKGAKATPVDYLLAIDANLLNLTKAVASANGVKPADIAAALLPGISAVLVEQLGDVSHLDEEQVAELLASKLAARLAQ
jgi:hypothetical protein